MRGLARTGEQPVELLCGLVSLSLEVRLDAGKRRVAVVAQERVVVHADHGDFRGHLQAGALAGAEDVRGTVVVRAEDGDWLGLSGQGVQQSPERIVRRVRERRVCRAVLGHELPEAALADGRPLGHVGVVYVDIALESSELPKVCCGESGDLPVVDFHV